MLGCHWGRGQGHVTYFLNFGTEDVRCRRKHLLLALLQSGTHCRINVDPLSFSALSSVL